VVTDGESVFNGTVGEGQYGGFTVGSAHINYELFGSGDGDVRQKGKKNPTTCKCKCRIVEFGKPDIASFKTVRK
jgi:hypothetical protein